MDHGFGESVQKHSGRGNQCQEPQPAHQWALSDSKNIQPLDLVLWQRFLTCDQLPQIKQIKRYTNTDTQIKRVML